MIIGLGLLQDEYSLTGEFQIFDGWARRVQASSLPIRVFSPAGERLRARAFSRHESGESLFKTFREQWNFIAQAGALAASVDALHLFLPTPNFLWIADRVKRVSGKPVVVTCLGEKADFSNGIQWRSLWEGPRFHLLRHAAARILSEGRFRCDRYVAGTEAVARQLKESGCPAGLITVAAPALPPEAAPDEASLAQARRMDKSRAFLYLGHFLPAKGLECLLQGFAALKDDEARLVLAWSGLGEFSKVNRLIDRLGIARQTSILDFPVHRSTLFAQSCALVLPYPVSYGQTSPPVVLLEAFRAGVPVVIPGFPHFKALGGEEGTMYFTQPGDWRDLARKMRHVLDHPDDAARMRQAQKARFRQLDGALDPRRFYEKVLTHGD